jgi:uncharacterized protein YjbI with pentapeptide repeats
MNLYLTGEVSLDLTDANFNRTKLIFSGSLSKGNSVDLTAAVFSNECNVTFDGVQFVDSMIDLRKTQLSGKSMLAFSNCDFRGKARVNAVKTGVSEKSILSFSSSRFHDNAQLYVSEAGFADASRVYMKETLLENQSQAVFPYTAFEDDGSGLDLVNATLDDEAWIDLYDADLGSSSFMWTRITGLARLTIGRTDHPVDLSRVRFLFADVIRMEFGNVTWGAHPRGCVVEEAWLGKEPFLSYVHVAELYRALRQNYENQLRFSEASDFFVREMELLRKKPRYWKLLVVSNKPFRESIGRRLRMTSAWVRSYFSIAELYNLLAEYGESYSRTLYWSVASILFIYPLIRFLRDGISTKIPIWEQYLQMVGSAVRLYFQVFALPSLRAIDVAFRLWSGLLLATFFIAVRRRFERKSSLS